MAVISRSVGWGALLAGLVVSCSVAAQVPVDADVVGDAVTQDAGIVDMHVVTVTGVQPGPGLWRVRRGDHTLYILGTQSPLPRDIQWHPDEVREVLSRAGVVLGSPGVRVGAGIGFFRGLTLMPSALRASRNPDGATLDTLLPPDVYTHWAALKQRYIGRDRGIERKRPSIAVFELYRAALDRHGLREGGVVAPVLDAALKARGMTLTPTTLEVKVDDPRQALADFRKEGVKPEDVACVRETLDIIERGLPQIAARANAWAVGDLDTLRAGVGPRRQVQACMSAWLNTETARKRGLADLDAQVRSHWLAAADGALTTHEVSFAMLSVDDLLGADGYLAALRARGDLVLAPDEADEVDASDATAVAR